MNNLAKHYKPENISDHIALSFTKFLRLIADLLNEKKYNKKNNNKTLELK